MTQQTRVCVVCGEALDSPGFWLMVPEAANYAPPTSWATLTFLGREYLVHLTHLGSANPWGDPETIAQMDRAAGHTPRRYGTRTPRGYYPAQDGSTGYSVNHPTPYIFWPEGESLDLRNPREEAG